MGAWLQRLLPVAVGGRVGGGQGEGENREAILLVDWEAWVDGCWLGGADNPDCLGEGLGVGKLIGISWEV